MGRHKYSIIITKNRNFLTASVERTKKARRQSDFGGGRGGGGGGGVGGVHVITYRIMIYVQ